MQDIVIIPFISDQPAAQVNAGLKKAVRAMDQARHCAVLWFKEIVERELYRELGYSSVYQYAAVELEFSRTRTGNFLQLARKLEALPRLKKEMEEGQVGYTKALEVIKVANAANEDRWVEEAKLKNRQELRDTVNRARQSALRKRATDPNQGELLAGQQNAAEMPVATNHRVSFELTGEQLARLEALVEKIHKQGGAPAGSNRAVLLLEAMAALAGQTESSGSAEHSAEPASTPPTQIHVHHCPECEKSHITTSRGEAQITPTEFEKLTCDARIAEPGKPNKATIPPGTRRRVLARDQHRCQAPGCRHTRFLEIHHLTPRSRGGTNAEENLITLCNSCHRLKHGHRGSAQSPAPRLGSGSTAKWTRGNCAERRG